MLCINYITFSIKCKRNKGVCCAKLHLCYDFFEVKSVVKNITAIKYADSTLPESRIFKSGDECYSFFNLQNAVPTARNYSEQNSKKFIEKYATPQYKCLLCHDTKQQSRPGGRLCCLYNQNYVIVAGGFSFYLSFPTKKSVRSPGPV